MGGGGGGGKRHVKEAIWPCAGSLPSERREGFNSKQGVRERHYGTFGMKSSNCTIHNFPI